MSEKLESETENEECVKKSIPSPFEIERLKFNAEKKFSQKENSCM